MAYEMLVGLDIIDEINYQKYRQLILPLAVKYGGSILYDFKVAEVLKSQTKDKINRVFTICFENEDKMNAFFLNPDYLTIKEKYFNKAVASTSIISSYTKEENT